MGAEVKSEGKEAYAETNKESNAEDAKVDTNNNERNNSRKGIVNTQTIDYMGQTKDIGAILALRSERFSHKVIFSTFIEKLKVYVLTNFNHASNILPIIESLTDPTEDVINDEPEELTPTEATSHVKVWLKQEQVKQ